jgi:hypothetical protein
VCYPFAFFCRRENKIKNKKREREKSFTPNFTEEMTKEEDFKLLKIQVSLS